MPRKQIEQAPALAITPAPVGGSVDIPKLQHALLLNRYFCKQLGADGFSALQRKLHDVRGGVDEDGLTYWYHSLYASDGLILPGGAAKLAEYDRRVTGYAARMNVSRANPPIALTYFQWLALIFTEMFLDRLYNDGTHLLRELNAAVDKLNAGEAYADLHKAYTGRGAWKYPAYAIDADPKNIVVETDLKKIAFWAATGSGKTLLMHIHIWQWQFYAKPTSQNGGILLITPNEDLSKQHIVELLKSGIPAARYEGVSAGGLLAFSGDAFPVIVMEITKLTEKKKGGGVSVNVAEFEAFGLILVDEGHRGTSGEKQRQRDLRDAVGKNALTLEYSATFGQIVNGATSAKKAPLLAEYASAILFDFSYPHFYADGYGKDYVILNSSDDAGATSDWIMLANLLSYYEQALAYAANPDALRAYNIERPLWIFVGNSVTGKAATDEDKITLTDIQTVVGFFVHFLSKQTVWQMRIQEVLSGRHPLKDGNGQDLLRSRFKYLRDLEKTASEIWTGVVRLVFRANAGESLTAVELKTASGEIGLRAGASNPYFGVINIGDVAGLKTLLTGQGVPVEEDKVGPGLFNRIRYPDSPVNVLVGSRKFMEGWDSFRVSSMGLLNIGQGEGSQIIQLFGRGVRLHGKNFCLKRSGFLRDQTEVPPVELRFLETLNIFGVRASYMAKFRDSLKNEGIVPDVEEVEIPIKIPKDIQERGLQVLRLHGMFDETVPLRTDTSIKVNLDLRPRIEMATGGLIDFVAEDAAGMDQMPRIRQDFAALLDWDRMTRSCMNFRREKGLSNLAFDTKALQDVFCNAAITVQSAPGYFATDTFTGLARIEDVVVSALTKYIATYHERRRKQWETKNLRLQTLTEEDGNLAFGKYVVKISTEKPDVAKRITHLVTQAKDLYYRGLSDTDGLPTAFFSRHLYQPLLQDWSELENIKPAGLEQSEIDFIADLRTDIKDHPERHYGRELFLLRNLVTYGVVFYDETGTGFYPDFLLWLVEDSGRQTLVFVDPHGIGREPITGAKIQLHKRLRDEITPRLRQQQPEIDLRLDAFILAPTHAKDKSVPIIHDNSLEDLEANHILFQKDQHLQRNPHYIGQMFDYLFP